MTKLTSNSVLVAVLLTAGLASAHGQNPTPLLTQPADKLVAVLQSQAGLKEKADACRELAVIGTKDAVPALAALLPDEKLSHMARYALETIPDPSADSALRDALGKVKGRLLAGVIGSLGVRRDAKAFEPLTKLLEDADPDVAQAAARALGRLGTPEAAKALLAAVAGVPEANLLAFCEGLARCTEALMTQGQRDLVTEICDHYRDTQLPHQVRSAALRGAILVRGTDGLALLRENLRGDDYILFAAAVRTALEMPGTGVTQALVAELGGLSADKQIVVLQALGQRGDAAAMPALLAAAKAGAKAVRVAAIRALPMIGKPSAVPVLVGLMADPEAEIAQAAQEGLAGLPGAEADAAVMTMLNSGETPRRLKAIDLIGRRRMTSRIPALLAAAGDPEASIRPAALKKLGELGGPAELSALLSRLMKYKEAPDLDAAEQALSAVCAKADQPESCTEMLTAGLAQAQPAQKSRLMSVFAAVGGAGALKTVRSAVDDSNAEVHGAAVRALTSWKTVDAAPVVLVLAKTATSPTDKMLCLRSYLDWASQTDLPADRRLSMCQQAGSLIQQPEEKKLLLRALGTIKTTDSLALVAPYLDDAATREEASAATVATSEAILKGADAAQLAPKLIDPLKKAAEVTSDANLAKRAKALLEQAQSKAGTK
jgi:HEAT repeat protein